MTVLTQEVRTELWADLMRRLSAERQAVVINKLELRAAIDAVDAWAEANASSFNSALPVAARTGLTPQQKAMMLAWVVMKRHEVG